MTSALLILIVDERHDDAPGCEQLREAGYCVVHARGAAAALSLIEQDEPDLIVTVDRVGREGRGPSRGENENGAFFRLGTTNQVALAGDHRRNAPWTTVSRS